MYPEYTEDNKSADIKNRRLKNNIPDYNSSSQMLTISEILLILRRRKVMILGAIFLCSLLGILFIAMQSPKFTANTQVQIDTRGGQVTDIDSVVMGLSADEMVVKSEIDIIKSDYMIGRIVDKQDLINHKEFNTKLQKKTFIDKMKDGLKTILAKLTQSQSDEQLDEEEQKQILRNQVIQNVRNSLAVYVSPRSYTINIKFTSKSPNLSARIANEFANQYLLDQLETKFEATKRANEWLNSRVADLKQKVQESEAAVQIYREENNLLESDGMTINDQQISELNTQLILAKTASAQAESRLKQAQRLMRSSNGIESAGEVLNSELIQRLREQEAEVGRKKADLASRYGSKHPKMINVTAELRDIRDKIRQEIEKVVQSLRNEVEVAKTRENTLQDNIGRLTNNLSRSKRAEVQLAELEREMNTNRALYENFLSRFKETRQEQDLQQADARIISKATPPVNPSSPNKPLVLAVSILFGIMIGVGLAFLIEILDDGFRASDQTEQITGIRVIGMLPTLKGQGRIIDYVIQKMTSAYSEALRSIRTAIHFYDTDNPPKVILVTSSLPKEGKSQLSSSLARLTAKSGSKVLLIDCDLRRPNIANIFGVKTEYGLADILMDRIDDVSVIMKDEDSGLDFIPALNNTNIPQELLSSKKMAALVEKMSLKYDLIVLDSPPIMAVADAAKLAEISDTTLFVVRWEKTPKKVVKSALTQLRNFNVNICGLVLSQVNIKKHKEYGYGDSAYYYGKYSEYYNN